MIIKNIFLNVFVYTCAFINVRGQEDCVPNQVQFINIGSNATLWWEPDPSETCEITEFQVDVVGDREDEYHFTTTEKFVDLSFLETCELWQFRVIPISHGIMGDARTLLTYVPLPPDADLTLSFFKFTISGPNILLEWDLTNQTLGDCRLEYRLAFEDLDRGTIQDFYVKGKSVNLNSVSPCVSYQLGIRAINQAHPTIEGPMKTLYIKLGARSQVAPTLKSVDIQATSINMTWQLEGDSNRCPVRTFYVDGGIHFNTSVSLQGLEDPALVSIGVNGLRPNSMYYLKAFVVNSGGNSQGTPVAIQTLDLSPVSNF